MLNAYVQDSKKDKKTASSSKKVKSSKDVSKAHAGSKRQASKAVPNTRNKRPKRN